MFLFSTLVRFFQNSCYFHFHVLCFWIESLYANSNVEFFFSLTRWSINLSLLSRCRGELCLLTLFPTSPHSSYVQSAVLQGQEAVWCVASWGPRLVQGTVKGWHSACCHQIQHVAWWVSLDVLQILVLCNFRFFLQSISALFLSFYFLGHVCLTSRGCKKNRNWLTETALCVSFSSNMPVFGMADKILNGPTAFIRSFINWVIAMQAGSVTRAGSQYNNLYRLAQNFRTYQTGVSKLRLYLASEVPSFASISTLRTPSCQKRRLKGDFDCRGCSMSPTIGLPLFALLGSVADHTVPL